MRLIDVTPLCRTQEPIPKEFRNKPAPVWLADLASAVSALDATGQGSSLTLEIVKERYPKSKIGYSYEAVWNRFFQVNPPHCNGRFVGGAPLYRTPNVQHRTSN
jgi:hypothetical protein